VRPAVLAGDVLRAVHSEGIAMRSPTARTAFPTLLVAAFLVAACSDVVSPERGLPGAPLFSLSPYGITLSRTNGSLNETGQQLAKGFDPKNPHLGDAIVATVYWVGSTYIVDSVIDFIADANNTRARNPYHLVEYVTAGGYSMATYVATNAQNFPDTSSTPGQILAVRAYLREPVTDGGVTISAWTGVEDNVALALGDHAQASGSDTGIAAAHVRPITVGAGAIAYTVTMSGLFGLDGPQFQQGYTSLGQGSDNFFKEEAAYRVFPSGGTTDPQWSWFYYDQLGTWLVTTLALNPPPHLAFTVQPSRTLPLLAIQPAVQVTALDALGNRVSTFNGQVTIAIGHNGGLIAPGTLSGTRTVTAVNGVATFSDLSIDQPGSGYTLVVSAPSVVGAESTPFNIGAF
jgi:hypothetical protein